MSFAKRIGLLGGSFDPVHIGHLHIAQHAQQLLALDEIRFIPCHIPPHKPGFSASNQQRIAMLELAINGHSNFVVDDIEIRQNATSYTVNTLAALRANVGDEVSLNFIIGFDSWLSLPQWHKWRSLFEFANLVVCTRPSQDFRLADSEFAPELGADIQQLYVQVNEAINLPEKGSVIHLQQLPLSASSSQIRAQISQIHRDLLAHSKITALPLEVANFITENKLYQK